MELADTTQDLQDLKAVSGIDSWRLCWLTPGVPFKGLPHRKGGKSGILRAGSTGIMRCGASFTTQPHTGLFGGFI